MRFWIAALLVGCQGETVSGTPDAATTTDTAVAGDSSGVTDSGSTDSGSFTDSVATDTGTPPTGGCDSTRGPTMVRLDTFCIDSTEVTRGQFRAFLAAPESERMAAAPSFCTWNTVPPTLPSATSSDNLPVGNVNFCDAKQFCTWAGKRLCGKIGSGPVTASQLTDPKVSQWYFACSANGTLQYPYGDAYVGSTCATETPGLSPVQGFPDCRGKAAPYNGIYDMNGNAEEWEDACDAPAPNEDTLCRGRGGGNEDNAKCTCKFFDYASAKARFAGLGFRCCKDL